MDNLENEGIRRDSFAFFANFDEVSSLHTAERLPPDTVRKLLGTLSLFPRTCWDFTPAGFLPKDWYPWRFRRRLSAISRPILQIDEGSNPRYLIAPGMVRIGAAKLLDYCYSGGYDAKDFPAGPMRRWIGTAENRRGHAFGVAVAQKLRDLGWEVKPGVSFLLWSKVR